MGASGAGKTTLLDVIACRKTTGHIGGALFMDGVTVDRAVFARNTAYCEQLDVHTALATVAEALHFSAALRLPGSVPSETRSAFVAEVMELLELQPISRRLVGEPGTSDSLSPSQRKVLTIAVELVSNSPILFLDEPTSGLDSRAAAMVMRVVAKVASTGRTVITTVHQPSADIFAMFDDLLLMQRGGWMVYFGPTGAGGASLVSYLQSVPGAHPCPPGFNPASWMLDVLSGTDSSAGDATASSDSLATLADRAPAAEAPYPSLPATTKTSKLRKVKLLESEMLSQRLMSSPEWAAQLAELDAACAPAAVGGKLPILLQVGYARSFAEQLPVLVQRTARTYSRSLGYVFQRIKVLTILNMLFGTVWYKEQQAVDCAPAQDADKFVCNNNPSGVQSLISIIFINSLFLPVVCMSALIPFMYRQVRTKERAPSLGSCAETSSPAHRDVPRKSELHVCARGARAGARAG
jgi:ABC-type multidrug transport system ATPase subunit